MNIGSTQKKLLLLGAVVIILALVVLIGNIAIPQNFKSGAWLTQQTAKEACTPSGNAGIDVSFRNTEPADSNLGMNVIAVDQASGKSVNIGGIPPQQTKTGQIDMGKTTITSGNIIFNLTWTSGASGTDHRTAAYKAITCNSAGPTNTPTIIPSQTPTKTPTPTKAQTPTPTQPLAEGTTSIALTIMLDSIGNRGDNANPTTNSLSNKNPLHPTRSLDIQVFNGSNQLITSGTGTITYNPSQGNYKGVIPIGTITDGNYVVKIKTDKYLRKFISGIVTLHAGQQNNLPVTPLVAGDTNIDNSLSILDYNTILGCYSDLSPPLDCQTQAKKVSADINDDGNVNQIDYNLFIRELSVQSGD